MVRGKVEIHLRSNKKPWQKKKFFTKPKYEWWQTEIPESPHRSVSQDDELDSSPLFPLVSIRQPPPSLISSRVSPLVRKPRISPFPSSTLSGFELASSASSFPPRSKRRQIPSVSNLDALHDEEDTDEWNLEEEEETDELSSPTERNPDWDAGQPPPRPERTKPRKSGSTPFQSSVSSFKDPFREQVNDYPFVYSMKKDQRDGVYGLPILPHTFDPNQFLVLARKGVVFPGNTEEHDLGIRIVAPESIHLVVEQLSHCQSPDRAEVEAKITTSLFVSANCTQDLKLCAQIKAREDETFELDERVNQFVSGAVVNGAASRGQKLQEWTPNYDEDGFPVMIIHLRSKSVF